MRTSFTLQRFFIAACLAVAGVTSIAAQTTDSPKTPPVKPTTAGGQGASASGPELPSQVCPECLVHLRAALALRDEWRTIQKQKSDLYQKLEENRARQAAQETIINEIETERASQEGTGGSGYDPATGSTTEVTTDAKGVAHVRTTDRNGKVVDEHTEQRGDTARLDKELATANARLNAMKQEAAGFEASLRSLSAKEKVVSDRLSDAVVQLAKCLEERCKHLIGKTLNDVATAFGLDPNGNGRDVPKPPAAADDGPDVSISIGVDPPEQVCPECLLQLRVVLSLRAQLRTIQKQKADLAQKVAENEAEQKKAQNRINYLNSRLGALEGTGGSGKDPATGLTTESYYGADGKVHITVRETASGKVVEERTEERDSGAKIRQDLAKANADLAALQKAADGLKAQRERLDAREKTVSDQLSNEVAELGKCIEEHCKHLYGQTLNDVATAFGLDPNGNGRDIPKPPRTTTTVRIVTVITKVKDGAVNVLVQNIIFSRVRAVLDNAVKQSSSRTPTWSGFQQFVQGWLTRRPAALASASQVRTIRPTRIPQAGDVVSLQSDPSAGPGAVTVSIVATGGSTGQAFELQVRNPTGTPVTIDEPDGLVLQPLKQLAKTASQKLAGDLQSQALSGYCLDFAKLPPSAGTLFKVADQAIQQQYAPMKNILQAARKLTEAGRLHPDSDPTAYGDAIRQWAIWSRVEKWDAKGFEQHFVERTRRNIETSTNQKWTKAIEQKVRELVPNRWNDITAVWAEAESAADLAR